ncbi:hypothetical protein EXS65_03800 [Candidatus Peribacteria bacterium]|nr:hypothetical protein [Candidatus Peribacteria bacterium]
MESPSSIFVPDRPRLIVNNGTVLAEEFVTLLKDWRRQLNQIFSKKSNEDSSWPPEDPLKCFRQYFNRPVLARELALELASIITEIEGNKGRFGDKVLYPHQLGQLKWLVMALIEDGSSFLIENAPGTGKTLVLGIIMHAATRLQIRGIMQENVIFATHKPFTLAQQAFSPADRLRRLALPPTYADINEEWQYFESVFSKEVKSQWKKEDWRKLRLERIRTLEEAKERILTVMFRGREKHSGDDSAFEAGLAMTARLLCSQGALIDDIDGGQMVLPLSQRDIAYDEGTFGFSGDLGKGIPPEYIRDGLVLSRKGGESNADQLIEKTAGQKKMHQVRVAMVVARSILSCQKSLHQVLENTGLILIDEGRNATTAFQEAIDKIRKKKRDAAIVCMATALRVTNGIDSRPYANRYSLLLSTEEAIEAGVLPDVGVDVFPGVSEPLYPSDSVQGLEQMIKRHFTDMEMPKAIKRPQPYECNSVVVVAPDSIEATVRRLREEYANRGLPAIVIPFNDSQKHSGGNIHPPKSDRIFAGMLDEIRDEHGKPIPKILVSAPLNIADGLSLTNLGNVTIGTSKNVGIKTIKRIFNRLQHSSLHKTFGSDYRGYFRQQLTQETLPNETLFHILGMDAGLDKDMEKHGNIRWIALQALLGKNARTKDRKLITTMKATHIPFTKEAFNRRKTEGSKSLLESEHERRMAMISRTERKGMTETKILKAPEWQTLLALCPMARKDWKNEQTRNEFKKMLLSVANLLATPFMKNKHWAAWEGRLLLAMEKSTDDPECWLEAAQEKLVSGVKLGNFWDRAPVMALPPIKVSEEEEINVGRNGEYENDGDNDYLDLDEVAPINLKSRDVIRIFEDDTF